MKNKKLVSQLSSQLRGEIKVPGDKSISHRSIILGAIAKGRTSITGFLFSEDCMATLRAFQLLGVVIEISNNQVIIHGVGRNGFSKPSTPIDCGNSGTTMRLLPGILVGQSFDSVLIGDSSLSKRPMERVVRPLKQMGADISSNDGRAPLVIKGGNELCGITYDLPEKSAQVKSCVLFAGMYASGETTISDSCHMRDHTERMLTSFSYPIFKSGNALTINSQSECQGTEINIPGDISSAAFFIVAATIIPNSELLIRDVGMNSGRIGILKILELMGASIEIVSKRLYGDEPVADIIVRSAELEGIDIPANLVPIAIDEFPIIFIAAAFASGQTLLHSAKELRYKESDRIKTMVTGLRALGIEANELDDGVYIRGGVFNGGVVDSCGDHRIAMAFAIAGTISSSPVIIDNSGGIATSFPNFVQLTNKLKMNIRETEDE
ncbi:MAG: 3-phosphoshikimate 1-carboxyvinyltransferase [Legionellaceae bacterium]|nr:3-phosphoshikimate 1-carboxyvinyltransferase [Legionellaceae bacterium]